MVFHFQWIFVFFFRCNCYVTQSTIIIFEGSIYCLHPGLSACGMCTLMVHPLSLEGTHIVLMLCSTEYNHSLLYRALELGMLRKTCPTKLIHGCWCTWPNFIEVAASFYKAIVRDDESFNHQNVYLRLIHCCWFNHDIPVWKYLFFIILLHDSAARVSYSTMYRPLRYSFAAALLLLHQVWLLLIPFSI